MLNSLLARYPIIPGEVSGESEIIDIEFPELSAPQTVNLETWLVPVTERPLVSDLTPDEIENTEPVSALSVFHLVEATAPTQPIAQTQLALNFG